MHKYVQIALEIISFKTQLISSNCTCTNYEFGIRTTYPFVFELTQIISLRLYMMCTPKIIIFVLLKELNGKPYGAPNY